MGLAERQVGRAEEGGVRFQIASKGSPCCIALGENDGNGGWGKKNFCDLLGGDRRESLKDLRR